MKKIISTAMLLVISLMICMTNVTGIGIVTDDLKRQIDFRPNGSYEFTYAIRATTPGDVKVSFIDENSVNLSQYLAAEPDNFKGTVDGNVYHFKVRMQLPESIEIPGPHTVKLKVEETDLEAKGSVVAAKSSSTAKITVNIPYPGKYIMIKRFSIPNAGEDEEVRIVIDAKNLGTETIQEAEGKITIFSLDSDTPIKSLTTESKALSPQQEATFETSLIAGELKPGKYMAEAKIKYESTMFTKKSKDFFNIGTLDVRLVNYSKKIQKKSIQKLSFLVENSWNNKITGLYAELVIAGYKKEIKTPSIDLGSFEKNSLEAYIDTEDLDLGRYNATVVLHYEGQRKDVPISFEIVEKKPSEDQSPSDISVGGVPISVVTIILIVIAIILIALNLNMHWNKKGPKKKIKKEKPGMKKR